MLVFWGKIWILEYWPILPNRSSKATWSKFLLILDHSVCCHCERLTYSYVISNNGLGQVSFYRITCFFFIYSHQFTRKLSKRFLQFSQHFLIWTRCKFFLIQVNYNYAIQLYGVFQGIIALLVLGGSSLGGFLLFISLAISGAVKYELAYALTMLGASFIISSPKLKKLGNNFFVSVLFGSAYSLIINPSIYQN